MTISYELYGNLYLNITNKCTNKCDFCIRSTPTGIGRNLDLWLKNDPGVEEIVEDLKTQDLSKYEELIFCGYGEPMIRLNEIVQVCKWIRANSNIKIRINTNGQANMIHKKDITPELEGLVDSVSISLNAKNAEEYDKICHSVYGEKAYEGLLDFASKCKEHVPEVILSVVDVLDPEDIEECRKTAEKINVNFRIRNYSE